MKKYALCTLLLLAVACGPAREPSVPLGSYLMCFRFLQVGWAFARTGELPHHDHAHVDGLEEESVTVPPRILEPQAQEGAL